MIVIETTEQLYVTHRDWCAILDPISIDRIRAAWGQGHLSQDELAEMFGVGRSTIVHVTLGLEQYAYLSRIERGSAVVSGGGSTVCHLNYGAAAARVAQGTP